MTTDEQRAYVRDEVRRILSAESSGDPGLWLVEGTHRGVRITFSYSDPPQPSGDDIDACFRLSTSVTVDLPEDYPLLLDLGPRIHDRAPDTRAPFYTILQGAAAPIDIATRLLHDSVCDELRRLGRFSLQTISTGVRRQWPPFLILEVPRWVETAEVARQMIDIAAQLVLALGDARTAADAAASANTGHPYRGDDTVREDLNRQRIAEIDAERRRVRGRR